MARLLVDGRWFDPIQADSVYESDLEDLIIAHSASLYPNFWVIKYKRMVQSEYGTAKPDLAFIEKNYRTWYLCEVELGTHDLSGHVIRRSWSSAMRALGMLKHDTSQSENPT